MQTALTFINMKNDSYQEQTKNDDPKRDMIKVINESNNRQGTFGNPSVPFDKSIKAMISVTSVTDKYILQPSLLSKHKQSLDWLSAAVLWKRELAFFQILLDQYASKFKSLDDKKKIDHFQSVIIYYKGELIDTFMSRLRLHEKKLAEMLESNDESKIDYFKEHEALMAELESLSMQFKEYKEEFFSFIEKAL